MQVFILKIIDKQITLSYTLEIGYSDTIYLSRNCHYCRLFLYQIILIGALSAAAGDQKIACGAPSVWIY